MSLDWKKCYSFLSFSVHIVRGIYKYRSSPNQGRSYHHIIICFVIISFSFIIMQKQFRQPNVKQPLAQKKEDSSQGDGSSRLLEYKCEMKSHDRSGKVEHHKVSRRPINLSLKILG